MGFSEFEVIGHRGASGSAPENTIAAFQKAIDGGATTVELDIHATLDGELVVLHDRRMERTTDLTGLVKEMPLADLRMADAGSWFSPAFAGERVPTLRNALEVLLPYVRVCIELKADDLTAKCVQMLAELDAFERVSLISFEASYLADAKVLEPRVQTGLLYQKSVLPHELIEKARETKVDFLSVHFSLASPEMAQATRAANLPLWVWTVNDVSAFEVLMAMGVQGIVTDFPELLAEKVRTRES